MNVQFAQTFLERHKFCTYSIYHYNIGNIVIFHGFCEQKKPSQINALLYIRRKTKVSNLKTPKQILLATKW